MSSEPKNDISNSSSNSLIKHFTNIFKQCHKYIYILYFILIIWIDNFYILSFIVFLLFIVFFFWIIFTMCILHPIENYFLGVPENTPTPEKIFGEYYEITFFGSRIRLLKYNVDSYYTYVYGFLFLAALLKLNYIYYKSMNGKINFLSKYCKSQRK